MTLVFLVGDDPLARSGIARLLAGRDGIAVAGEAASGDDLDSAAQGSDVVVWDAGTADHPALERLRERAAGAPVLAIVASESQAGEALAAGARGVLLRDIGAEPLAAAVRAVARGLVVLDEALAESLLRTRLPVVPLPEPLTPREMEVLQLLAQGLSNKVIAQRLGISDHTAKFHVNSILGKLGAQSRTEALAQAARLGLVIL